MRQLDAHLAELRATLPSWLPDPDWSGNAVLDFEAWSTVWELNDHPDDWHGERYRTRWQQSAAQRVGAPTARAARLELAAAGGEIFRGELT